MLARCLAASLIATALLVPLRAHAYIAREPLVRVLRQASPDLRACRERHALPDGRYVARLVIDWTGKVTEIAVGDAPETLTPAAESCLAAAFTHLRFNAWERPREEPETVAGPGRRSVVPPDLRRGARRTPGIIAVVWPFLFSSPAPDAPDRSP